MSGIRVELQLMTEAPGWARPPCDRVPAPFGGTRAKTISRLIQELDHIGAGLVVIQLTGPNVEIRLDGWPSARSKIDPPVAVSFDSDHGDLTYRSDRYTTWEGNVHAVMLTLDRLRSVERYGCAAAGEQYRGWAALPAGASGTDPMQTLADAAGMTIGEARTKPRRTAALARASTHPDRNNGHRDRYDLVDAAARTLGL